MGKCALVCDPLLIFSLALRRHPVRALRDIRRQGRLVGRFFGPYFNVQNLLLNSIALEDDESDLWEDRIARL